MIATQVTLKEQRREREKGEGSSISTWIDRGNETSELSISVAHEADDHRVLRVVIQVLAHQLEEEGTGSGVIGKPSSDPQQEALQLCVSGQALERRLRITQEA